jgi:hypothetical protein
MHQRHDVAGVTAAHPGHRIEAVHLRPDVADPRPRPWRRSRCRPPARGPAAPPRFHAPPRSSRAGSRGACAPARVVAFRTGTRLPLRTTVTTLPFASRSGSRTESAVTCACLRVHDFENFRSITPPATILRQRHRRTGRGPLTPPCAPRSPDAPSLPTVRRPARPPCGPATDSIPARFTASITGWRTISLPTSANEIRFENGARTAKPGADSVNPLSPAAPTARNRRESPRSASAEPRRHLVARRRTAPSRASSRPPARSSRTGSPATPRPATCAARSCSRDSSG